MINDPYQNSFLLKLNGSDRINVGPSLITLNGSVACGAMSLDTILNLTTTGLASHIQLNGSDRITLNQTNTTLHGEVACGPLSASSATVGGAITASSATVVNTVSCASLTANEINLSMPGLSSNIMVNGAGRLSFTQLNTRILGDLEVTGNVTVNGTGGGRIAECSRGLWTHGQRQRSIVQSRQRSDHWLWRRSLCLRMGTGRQQI